MRTYAPIRETTSSSRRASSPRRSWPPPVPAASRSRSGGHEFDRIHVLASSRNPLGAQSGDVVTAQSDAAPLAPTPAPAPPVSPPTPPPPTRWCSVSSGPAYSPTGTIPVTNSGGSKSASFNFSAAFDTSTDTPPSCCEVRQYIKWDDAFHSWSGGPPHSGFPSSAAANTWIEDRDDSDKRYGHRSGPHSDPVASCGDEYTKDGSQDQANGDKYCGNDNPGGPDDMTGQWKFKLKAIDTCNSNAVKASSSVITINW